MESTAKRLDQVIQEESTKDSNDNTTKELEILLEDIRKTGLFKGPTYNLPLVDTIGKTYYSSINKRS